ncbi:unnamed protein product [Brassica rapa]|uniref:Uncharacterized protein n=1 Tax=Brassica campestris TaxID=3711 RepID=A0A8D9MHU9_BRACM|nr:unnamed protein product [Brassica rapa]
MLQRFFPTYYIKELGFIFNVAFTCCGGGGDGKTEMILTEEALNIVLGISKRLPPVLVSLQEALGRIFVVMILYHHIQPPSR